MQRNIRTRLVTFAVLVTLAGAVQAQSVLILNGLAGGTSTVPDALVAFGYNVVEGTLAPGQITAAFANYSDIEQVWILNDRTLGNTGSPADPSLDFDADDLSALATFEASHSNWIFDSLAWRNSIDDPDARALTQNECYALAVAGGGIVLGTDDGTGDLLLQHVNQVCGYFGFAPFVGSYLPDGSQQSYVGALIAGPYFANPMALVTTGSDSDVPHGLQPNGRIVHTVLIAADAPPQAPYWYSPAGSDAFGPLFVAQCCHLVTTTIDAGDSQDFAAFCFADGLGAACPCGNDDATAGCANSSGVGGRLAGTGSASTTADDLVLEASQLPTNVFSIIFSGSTAISLPFGDGVRCAGGSIRRFGVHDSGPLGGFSQANIASYAGYSIGTLRFFQVWFRDPTGPCGQTTNVTNALAVLFSL